MPSPIVVAEISCNHCGSLEKAKELITQIKEKQAADVIKIQLYTPDCLTLPSISTKEGDKSLYDFYTETQTPLEWAAPLFDHARSLNIPIFSSVFSYLAATS